jgi:inhibitor of KinA sporulation pathway (predicted exonuclease)
MNKLAIVTDLHADINHLSIENLAQLRNYLKEQQISHLHLAGDTANKVDRALAVVDFFNEAMPTTFHWGNHEMADITQEQDFEDFANPFFLNFKTLDLSEQKNFNRRKRLVRLSIFRYGRDTRNHSLKEFVLV